MVCYYCGGETAVLNSRPQKRANRVWRRRQCLGCKNTVSTLETVDFATSLSFRTQLDALTPFERDVVFMSVYDCLKHRKTALRDATALTETILSGLHDCMVDNAVDRAKLSAKITATLGRFDHAAAVQYAAYHP